MLTRISILSCLLGAALLANAAAAAEVRDSSQLIEGGLNVRRGVIAVLGSRLSPQALVQAAKTGRYIIYYQSADAKEVAGVRVAAEKAGLLGTKIFADTGSLKTIHLANNIADGIAVSRQDARTCSAAELLRVVRPRAVVLWGDRKLVKEVPPGIDEWTHPYHAADNNPQSADKLARGAFRTQFIGYPKFSPMPEQTVIAGGRIFKAMGHIAHKANQNEMLNTLLCINAYNGTILWKRPLPKGFMIHRNTMIATDDTLYMGDYESCKVIDAATGKIRQQIKVPKGISDGPVWKWMGLKGDTLFALVGSKEILVDTQKASRRGLGHWPWAMWQGHGYKDPKTAFGFGRTIIAVDLKTKKIRWHHREKDFIDARGVCMKGSKLFYYSPQKFLAALDTQNGSALWKNSDKDLLAAIGPDGRAQGAYFGYATSCFVKCNDSYLFFAGPQRSKLVVASAENGKLKWTHDVGNLQLVLRKDGIYAAGPQRKKGSVFDYDTGKVLKTFIGRRACTRATGSVDSIFFRASGGTVRLLTETNTEQHIAPMR
ncbi:MAG: PQQ-binding-like beta-propeller repeat protein, partial [Planctomycetes bacterium]|nr:PQQ-binding-like beta-propeller repeat protein [Planctomycetota bacterium]